MSAKRVSTCSLIILHTLYHAYPLLIKTQVERRTSGSSSSGVKRKKVWEESLTGRRTSTNRMGNRQRLIEDDADIKFRNETPQQQIEDRDDRSEERFDSLVKRVRVLEKIHNNMRSELDRLIRDIRMLEKNENNRQSELGRLIRDNTGNDTSLEMDSMQSSSATTCRESDNRNRCYKKSNPLESQQQRHATRKTSNGLTICQKEKLSMLHRVGTVCCVIFVVSRLFLMYRLDLVSFFVYTLSLHRSHISA